ncbi:hypothetical protein Hanom_Chr13g01239801 [Helianthus anomalus]
MAETSSPHNVEGENPEPSSPLVAEEKGRGTAGGGLPVLQWARKFFDRLMLDIQMPPEYGAFHPSEGDTGADAPAGYVTMWADFFGDCNLRLPLTVFVVEVLEWYKIHISQLSPLGMIRIRNFESTFRALGIEPAVGDFRRFYQMTVSLGFFSFRQRDGSPKLMTPPNGMTKWKTKFFYIKAAAIVANMTFRNATETIITKTIAVPSLKTVEWFPRLQTIEWVKLSNTQLWVLRMMLTRRNKKSKPVVREKSGGTMPPYGGCLPRISRVGLRQLFVRMARRSLMSSFEITSGCLLRPHWQLSCHGAKVYLGIFLTCDLGALGDPDAKGVPKKQVAKGVRFRQKKIPEVTVVPHLVPQAAGISPSSFRRYMDYVIVFDTLEGLGTAAGGKTVGPQPVAGKRQVEETAAGAGGPKRQRLKSNRTDPTPKKPVVTVELQDKDFSIFDAPASPPRTTGAGVGASEEPVVPKEPVAPFVEPVRDPMVEKVVEKTAAQIFDTVDSSDNLISPNEGDGLDLRFPDVGKPKSDAEAKRSFVGAKVTGSATGGAGDDGPPIQPGESELEYYYRTYTQGRSTILGGLGTPFEVERARAAPRELRINQISTMLVGTSIVANAILEDYKVLGRREEEVARMRAEAEELVKAAHSGAEQLEKDRAAFEKQRQTAEWAATAQLKQVRTLAKLLSNERKSWNKKLSNERKKWNESWAKQNDNMFRARQELTNAKAANAALVKDKAAAEAVAIKAQQAEALAVKALKEATEAGARAAKALEEAKERESRSSKALEEANAERIRMGKVVASLQAEVQAREVTVTDLIARTTVAEERASATVEAKDALTSSFNQLEADREWIRSHGIARIVQAIMDALETATGLDLVKERAREAGFKAGYNRCIAHMNVMSIGGVIEERSGFRDVDTEGRLNAVVASFYDTSLSCVEELDECLEAADYVDRLRMLYADAEKEDPAGGAGDGAGTSGTK